MPIHFIDGKCHIKQLKAGKSRETCLTKRTQPISHYITSLVINALGGGHSDTHTYQHMNQSNFKKTGACGLWLCSPGLKNPMIKASIFYYKNNTFQDNTMAR